MRCNTILFILALLLQGTATIAQTLKGWDELDQAIAWRAELKDLVRKDARKRGAFITDSLRQLQTPDHLCLLWDERWMLYHWSDAQRLLLDEIQEYTLDKRLNELYANSLMRDSLFEVVDKVMFDRSENYPAQVKDLGFNPEEQEFLMIHLQYLLRNNSENEKEIRADFIRHYPESKYNYFIKNFMTLPPNARKKWWAVEVAVVQNNWTDEMQRHVNSGWGMHFSLNYYKKRWNATGHYAFSRQKTLRYIYGGFEDWPKGNWSGFNNFGMSVGYNLIDASNIRLYPFLKGDIIKFHSVAPTDEEGNSLPNVYDDYSWYSVSGGGGIGVDIKMKKRRHNPKGLLPPNYAGIKMRAGYSWNRLGQKNEQLAGNMVYITLGFQITDL